MACPEYRDEAYQGLVTNLPPVLQCSQVAKRSVVRNHERGRGTIPKNKNRRNITLGQQRLPVNVLLEGRLCGEWTEAEDPGPPVTVLNRNMRVK